jgi:NAD(P)H-quinone oxidoreductase subunit 5
MIINLPTIFLIMLAISLFSAVIFLIPRIPLNYVRIHVAIISLPPMVALLALLSKNRCFLGPWHFDSLSWLLAVFVLTLGLVVQRYSVRYLFGDHSYRKYFALLTFTIAADSLAWLSDDLRLLLVFWGGTLFGLTMLIRLKREWKVVRNVSLLTGRFFALSWFFLLAAVIWVTNSTGQWRLSAVLTSISQLDSWEKTSISLLLIFAVIIPSVQWPFHRWMLDSVVVPTPVSAIMHAGIVNVGGIILTLFAPLLSGNPALIILFLLSSISILIGTGIMLVHVDYKRQLVGSTMAQMGFMLIQCALGAYVAAIVHAVLHGLFKSTLFLQAGSTATSHHKNLNRKRQPISYLSILTGGCLGFLIGFGYWLISHGEAFHFISSFLLGWSVAFAWIKIMAFADGPIGRMGGFSLFAGGILIFAFVHQGFYKILNETIQKGIQSTFAPSIFLLLILLASSGLGLWLSRNRSSLVFTVIYLWLVRLGEPHKEAVESHPNYQNLCLKEVISDEINVSQNFELGERI